MSRDVPWTSFTYGVLPPKSLFTRNFKALVGSDYGYLLKGSDARVADQLGFDAGPTRVTAAELYRILKTLQEANDEGDDDAGSIASSILQTLHIEWI